jgi:hypothetical protein
MRLLSLSEGGGSAGLTAKEWCEKYNLIAATNAGMFQQDYRTHVGYMKVGSHINNGRKNEYQSVAVFGPLTKKLCAFRIFDVDSCEIDSVVDHYRSVVQNLRLIDRAGRGRLAQQPKRWSEAAFGEDRQGRALFVFCRSPYSMHDLNKMLMSLPIDLVCAQHLEGGPEAQLYVRWAQGELDLVGSYETAFNESDKNRIAWPIPNVIGVARKKPEP